MKLTRNNIHRIYTYIILFLVVVLPLSIYIIGYFNASRSGITFTEYNVEFNTNVSGITADNPIYSIVSDTFGEGGVYQLIPARLTFLIDYITYVVNVYLFYLLIEVLAFVPKFVGRMLSKVGVEDNA